VVAGAASPLLTAPIGPTIVRLAAPDMNAMVAEPIRDIPTVEGQVGRTQALPVTSP
jgi:hypothetical protein